MIEQEPYPGLRPFLRDEVDIFFGRERQIDTMIEQLREHRFLAVTGTSGSGKSSLVRTGLLSALEAGFLDTAGGRWRILDIRPGSKPLAALVPELLKALNLPATPVDQELARASLERGPLSIAEFLNRVPGGSNDSLLIVVDQFEELFRYSGPAMRNEVEAFVQLLIGSALQTEVPIYIVLTMRSDFLGDCARFEGLPELINRSQYLTPRMKREEYRRAIEAPARVFGGRVAPSVTSRLLNDMVSVPDQLCLVQHALLMMWRRAKRRGGDSVEIGLDDYVGIGGLGAAISQHADQVLDAIELPPTPMLPGPATGAEAQYAPPSDKVVIAERMFRRLTEGGRGREADVRRPTSFGELLEITCAREVDLRAVIDKFRAPGNNFLTPLPHLPIENDSIIDISHESLIRQWKKLREWTDRESESAATYRRIELQAILWQQGGAGLWTSRDLDRAMTWRAEQRPSAAWAKQYGGEYDTAVKFLDASRSANRNAKYRRRAAVVVGIFLPIAIGLLAYWGYAKDQQSTELRTLNEENAKARRLAEQWKSDALKAQLNSIIASAEADLGKADAESARGLVLATTELMAAADPAGEWKTDADSRRRYMNALISTLRTDAREIYVGDGRFEDKRIYGAYSADSQIFAWATSAYVQFNDTRTGLVIKRYPRSGKDDKSIRSFSLSPDGRLIALVADGRVDVFDVDAGRLTAAVRALGDVRFGVAVLAETSTGSVLAALTTTGEFRAWTLKADGVEAIMLADSPDAPGADQTNLLAIDCEASRCATFDGAQLRLYELEETARQTSHGAVSEYTPPSQGDTRLLLLGDLILLGSGTNWASYERSNDAITRAVSDWLNGEFTMLYRGGPRTLRGLRQVRDHYLSIEITPSSTNPEGSSRMFKAREVIALAPNGSGSVVSEESSEGGGLLKVLHFASRVESCSPNCKGLVTTKSRATFLFSDRGLFKFDQTTGKFVALIEDLIEDLTAEVTKDRREGGQGADLGIELLGATSDPDQERIYLLFSTGKGPALKRRIANIDLEERKVTVSDSDSPAGPSANPQASSDRSRAASDAPAPKARDVTDTLVDSLKERGAWPRIAIDPWDSDSDTPSILIYPAVGNTSEKRVETPPGTRVRISGDKAVAFNRQSRLLESIRAAPDAALSPGPRIRRQQDRDVWKWADKTREIVSAGFIADDRFFVASSEGLVEILRLGPQYEAPVARFDVKGEITGAVWSFAHQEFVVISRLKDAEEVTTISGFDAEGALRHTHEQSGNVLTVSHLDAEIALVVGPSSYAVVPLVRWAPGDATEQYARAVTERWLLRADIVKKGLAVLGVQSPTTREAVIGHCLPQPAKANAQAASADLWMRRRHADAETYAAACTQLYRARAGSGFRAWVASLLTARYLTGGSDSESGLLAYQLAQFARGDHVAALYVAGQLFGKSDTCASERQRRLPDMALLEGGVIAPEYFANEWDCSSRGGPWLPAGAEARLQSLARNGDPMAHTLLGMLTERKGNASRDALAHYYAASLIFHDVRRSLATYGFAQVSEAWQTPERMANRRRAALAGSHLPAEVLEALSTAQRWLAELPENAKVDASNDRFIGQTASAIFPALETDLSRGIEDGLAKIEKSVDLERDRIVRLGLEARYYLSKQYLDAGATEDKVRPLFFSILRAAADAPNLAADLSALSRAALKYFQTRTTHTAEESDTLKGLAYEMVDRLAGPSPTGLSDTQKRRAVALFAEGAPADRTSRIEAAILALVVEDRLTSVRSGWDGLIEQQRRVYELLREESDLNPYRPIILGMSWRYVDIARQHYDFRRGSLPDKEKLSKEQEVQAEIILTEGLRLHVLVEKLLDSVKELQDLSNGYSYAAYLAENTGQLDRAISYHEQAGRLSKEQLTKSTGNNDTRIWEDSAVDQRNLARVLERRAEGAPTETEALPYLQRALVSRQEVVEIRRKLNERGTADSAAANLFFAMLELSSSHWLLDQSQEALPMAIDAYRLIATGNRSAVSEERLRRNSLYLGNIVARLNQQRRLAESTPSAAACDQGAGQPVDPLLLGKGIAFVRIDGDAAVDACLRALADDANNPRYIFQHGRALSKKSSTADDQGRSKEEGIKEYNQAAEKGYPVAFNNLAVALDGLGATEAERKEAANLYLEYFNRTVHCCGFDVARYLLGRLDGPNHEALGGAVLDILEWTAELGDAKAHEEVARVLADETLAKLKPEWAGLTSADRAVWRVMHLIIAGKLHAAAGRPADAKRVTALVTACRLSSQQLSDARARADAWEQKGFRDAPVWMIPPAVPKLN